MKAEEDTREISVGQPEHNRGDSPMPELRPWGIDAVPLGKGERGRGPTGRPHHTEIRLHRRVALAAIVCATCLLGTLGANTIGGKPESQAKRPHGAQTRTPPRVNRQKSSDARATRQSEQRGKQVRSTPHHRSLHSTHRTRPASGPANVPAPEPTPEPVPPRPVPAPTPSRSPKPLPASGSTVEREFGFER